MTVYDPPSNVSPAISVRSLIEDPGLELAVEVVAGEGGLDRCVRHRRIQKSGLALVGHLHGIVATRIQILGETELSFLERLSPEGQEKAAAHFFASELCCALVTRGVAVPAALINEADRTETPLLVCRERSSTAITQIHTVLDDRLAPRARIHGVLVDVFEVGVLLLGASGIGKSECALELVMRGHRLVADDVVECDYRPPGMIFGEPNEMLRHHMEVRGLGILDIRELYGVTAICDRKRIDLVVQLQLWSPDEKGDFDRLGVEEHFREILGVPVRELRLPVLPGRNTSSIIEIAARHELLRQAGKDAAREFVARLDARNRTSDSGGHDLDWAAAPHRGPLHGAVRESAVPPPVRPARRGRP